MVEIRQLELFLAVMENGSVTKAAHSMNLSPGAVSLQLQHLAEKLRTDLFVRTGKRLVPTPAALRLTDMARSLLRQVQAIEQEFENDPYLDTRPFHLATGATTLIHRLGKPLRLLRKKYPNTPIQVTVAATEGMVAGLLERRFDLALISLPFEHPNLTIIPLFDEELLILKPSPTVVRGSRVDVIQAEELAQASFILYPKGSNMRGMIDRFFQELGISPKVLMEADDTEAIKRLVESGFGYSILPGYALRSQSHHFHVYRLPGRRLIRKQALAMTRVEYPRRLTESIARFFQTALR